MTVMIVERKWDSVVVRGGDFAVMEAAAYESLADCIAELARGKLPDTVHPSLSRTNMRTHLETIHRLMVEATLSADRLYDQILEVSEENMELRAKLKSATEVREYQSPHVLPPVEELLAAIQPMKRIPVGGRVVERWDVEGRTWFRVVQENHPVKDYRSATALMAAMVTPPSRPTPEEYAGLLELTAGVQ